MAQEQENEVRGPLTAAETARTVGAAMGEVYKRCYDGRLRAWKDGDIWRIDRDSVDAWVAKRAARGKK